jgi:hypothetical protein
VFTDVDVKQCITVVIIDDDIIEVNEQFTLELELPGASEYYELLQGNAVIVIEDNDGMYSWCNTIMYCIDGFNALSYP